MGNGILTDGYPTMEEIKKANGWPTEERFAKGPVAVVECVQEIPCNPCEKACPSHAICVGEPITRTPQVDREKCTGCGLCVAACSGLAIVVIDKTYSETEATVSFPFEYLPLPEKGDRGYGLGRDGRKVCEAEVISVRTSKAFDHTNLLTIKVPADMAMKARFFKA